MGFSSEVLGLLGVDGLDVAAGALPSTSSLLGTWSWEGFPAVVDPFSLVSRVAGFCCPEAACSYAFPYRCVLGCSSRHGVVVRCRRACRVRGAFPFARETCVRADFAGLKSIGHRNGKLGALMLLVKSQRSSNF